MSAKPDSIRLGFELQKISESATWAHYVRLHPHARVGFCYHNDTLLLTLLNPGLGHLGIVKYASNAAQLIEVAHLALFEMGEIEVL
jgi:hypothetical protein